MLEWQRFTITPSQLKLGMNCLLLLAGIFICYQWWQDWSLLHQPVHSTATLAQNPNQTLTTITDAHLFGGDINKEEVPLSNMQIQITGIVQTPNPDFSKVYLSIAGRPSKVYRVGSNINGVLIQGIYNDHVIFNNNGRLEKLMLQRTSLEFKSLPAKDKN